MEAQRLDRVSRDILEIKNELEEHKKTCDRRQKIIIGALTAILTITGSDHQQLIALLDTFIR